jgi:UDP-arabinose 4-epimerase
MRVRVLVTGGAGYVGSHVCKALAAAGFEPIVYDDLSRGSRSTVKWGPIEIGDISDTRRLVDVLKAYRPDAVMHLAAFTLAGESVEDPLPYYRNNIGGTQSLLEAMISFQAIPIVFSSTCAIYEAPITGEVDEDHPKRPLNPYGFTKLVCEQMLADLGNARGLRSISLRYFNVAGADPDGEIGASQKAESQLIPIVLKAARDGVPIRIFGDDYNTPDGTCVRDYIHVSDVADAHVLALGYLLGGGESLSLNLANARGYSVREVIAVAERVCNIPIRFDIAPRRIGDPAMLVGDARRARQVLRWSPRRSQLESQIRDSWNWNIKSH